MENTKIIRHVKFSSWNAFANRFVKPPAFEWHPVPRAVKYRIGVAGRKQRHAAWFETVTPAFDFAPIWESLPQGRVDLLIHALDEQGNHVEECSYAAGCAPKSFFKVPGWNRDLQEPLDWAGTVQRNVAYLLASATYQEPHEVGWPLTDNENWPSCNAFASHSLILWNDYYRSVKEGNPKLFDLAGFFV